MVFDFDQETISSVYLASWQSAPKKEKHYKTHFTSDYTKVYTCLIEDLLKVALEYQNIHKLNNSNKQVRSIVQVVYIFYCHILTIGLGLQKRESYSTKYYI